MVPFYEAMTKYYTPAALGNAKSKIVEPYFKRLNVEYCQKQANWSGFGITADKDNQRYCAIRGYYSTGTGKEDRCLPRCMGTY